MIYTNSYHYSFHGMTIIGVMVDGDGSLVEVDIMGCELVEFPRTHTAAGTKQD